MMQIVSMRRECFNSARNRDEVLGRLLPKFLGLLWETGRPDSVSGLTEAKGSENLTIGGLLLRPGLVVIHAYHHSGAGKILKVFSAHLAVSEAGDPSFFKNWNGQCGVLSWRRGSWEGDIMACSGAARNLEEVSRFGLTATKH